jgi:hypothetical protein
MLLLPATFICAFDTLTLVHLTLQQDAFICLVLIYEHVQLVAAAVMCRQVPQQQQP